jgi:hypothetical protein
VDLEGEETGGRLEGVHYKTRQSTDRIDRAAREDVRGLWCGRYW